MITVAIFFAVLGWILAFVFMGWLVAIVSYATFLLWFRLRDVGFLERFGAKKIFAWIVAPILSIASDGIIPGAVVTVVITIVIVDLEDKLIEKKLITREQLRTAERLLIEELGAKI